MSFLYRTIFINTLLFYGVDQLLYALVVFHVLFCQFTINFTDRLVWDSFAYFFLQNLLTRFITLQSVIDQGLRRASVQHFETDFWVVSGQIAVTIDTADNLFWSYCCLFPVLKAVPIKNLIGVFFFKVAVMVEVQFFFALFVHQTFVYFSLACWQSLGVETLLGLLNCINWIRLWCEGSIRESRK